MKSFIYQVINVGSDGSWHTETFHSKNELLQKYSAVGVNFNPSNRKELQGQPILDGVYGPMYNGLSEEGIPIIRYETAKVYKALSF